MSFSRTVLDALLVAMVALFAVAAPAAVAAGVERPSFGGRAMIVYVPTHLPSAGARALVVVLHGGLGNADRIESARSEHGLNLDALAEKDGFIVAYLNGTPVTLRMGPDVLGWNAGGGCCGQSAANGIDDVGYIRGAVGFLAARYGFDRTRVFVMGHSNGAMMAQRMICETDVFAAAVAVSGPLNLDVQTCPYARGRRVLAIHGADDQNVPIKGGQGTKGVSQAVYRSEDASRRSMEASGASYTLKIVANADHMLDHIDAALTQAEGTTVARLAVGFFGLEGSR
jgi:poly(3-hydroxybutyrate) depolymerase